MRARLEVDEFGVLACPACKEISTHFDRVVVRTPMEYVSVKASGEDKWAGIEVDRCNDGDIPAAPSNLRRHLITLLGWCEHCYGEFAITFMQHKGDTIVTLAAIE